ncbi:MAG: hypothetical protein CVU20_03590 [Betaproteobacteria bacterium HGW-Betaproteobacteria-14]|nr:MAG: hypothetical protein CVU20_03590 [Betaproteobacteria bacterium HGW-Betaproteobacteria-14]
MLARLTDSFALMYRTGIPVIEALGYCEKITSNLPVRRALVRARDRIANGASISDSFAMENLFPSLVVRMLRVGENTGGLDTALLNVAYFYNRDVKESIEKVQAMIEPAMTLILGTILGWVMLSVLGPIYDVITKLKI